MQQKWVHFPRFPAASSFSNPLKLANFGGDEKIKVANSPQTQNSAENEKVSIYQAFPIYSGLVRPTKKTRRTYVQLSTTSRSQRLREVHCFKKSLRSCGLRIPLFHRRRIPSPGTRRMCPWRVTLFLTALAVVVHGAGSPLKLDRCWC